MTRSPTPSDEVASRGVSEDCVDDALTAYEAGEADAAATIEVLYDEIGRLRALAASPPAQPAQDGLCMGPPPAGVKSVWPDDDGNMVDTTPAQDEVVRALVEAKVREPLSILPDYWAVELAGISGKTATALVERGLCALPICSGGRSGYPVYSGEITAEGRALRDAALAKAQGLTDTQGKE